MEHFSKLSPVAELILVELECFWFVFWTPCGVNCEGGHEEDEELVDFNSNCKTVDAFEKY